MFWCKERDEIKGLMGDGNVSARSAPSVYLVQLGARDITRWRCGFYAFIEQ
jgi:hypothetical protein